MKYAKFGAFGGNSPLNVGLAAPLVQTGQIRHGTHRPDRLLKMQPIHLARKGQAVNRPRKWLICREPVQARVSGKSAGRTFSATC